MDKSGAQQTMLNGQMKITNRLADLLDPTGIYARGLKGRFATNKYAMSGALIRVIFSGGIDNIIRLGRFGNEHLFEHFVKKSITPSNKFIIVSALVYIQTHIATLHPL